MKSVKYSQTYIGDMRPKKIFAYLGATMVALAISGVLFGFGYIVVMEFDATYDKIDDINAYEVDFDNRSNVKDLYNITKKDAGWFDEGFDVNKELKDFLEIYATVDDDRKILSEINRSDNSSLLIQEGILQRDKELWNESKKDVEFELRDIDENEEEDPDMIILPFVLIGFVLGLVAVLGIIGLYNKCGKIKELPNPSSIQATTVPYGTGDTPTETPEYSYPYSFLPPFPSPPRFLPPIPMPISPDRIPTRYCRECNILYGTDNCPVCKDEDKGEKEDWSLGNL